MTDRRVDEEIELLRSDLAELDGQLADGDIDRATADRLAEKYRSRLEALEGAATTAAGEDPASVDAVPATEGVTASPRRRVSGRVLVGSALVGVAIVAITVFAVNSLGDRSIAGAEGVVGDVVAGEGPVDLSSITNEQMEEVVAANPDVIGMRLALARRYFEAGEFDKALDHYFTILESEQQPEALANIGWMTYLSGRPDIAVGYLEAALALQPDYLPAKWFAANVYVSLDRPGEAIPYLVEVASSPDTPQEVRDGAVTLLDQIGAAP